MFDFQSLCRSVSDEKLHEWDDNSTKKLQGIKRSNTIAGRYFKRHLRIFHIDKHGIT